MLRMKVLLTQDFAHDICWQSSMCLLLSNPDIMDSTSHDNYPLLLKCRMCNSLCTRCIFFPDKSSKQVFRAVKAFLANASTTAGWTVRLKYLNNYCTCIRCRLSGKNVRECKYEILILGIWRQLCRQLQFVTLWGTVSALEMFYCIILIICTFQ